MKAFTEHPNSVNETYKEHMVFALKKAKEVLKVSVILGVHAFLPFLYETEASNRIKKLNEEFNSRGDK